MFSDGGDWQLSGTLGQWDGSESQDLSGGQWTLTGAFWPVTVDKTDRLFRDGFESWRRLRKLSTFLSRIRSIH